MTVADSFMPPMRLAMASAVSGAEPSSATSQPLV
jgi:hypothetical protein